MLDLRNSHNLTQLTLGVKTREIEWKKYESIVAMQSYFCSF